MKTTAKWINYGPVDAAALKAFDDVRPHDVGRGSFLSLLAHSEAGMSVDLAPFAGETLGKRAMFGRCRVEEYDRTRKGMMPTGVTRTGFLKAMTSIAGTIWED